jgi:hypothetical protein
MRTSLTIAATALGLLLLGPGTGSAGIAPSPPPAAQPSLGRQAVAVAKKYLGVRYTWGGASPQTGFDCSGLVMYVYAQLGIQLTHYSGAQWKEGYRLTPEQLRKGDLVFFHKSKAGPQHVGMYVGDGKFIHAPHTGDVVKISSLSDPNYARSYVGAVRPYGFGPPIVFPVIGLVTYTNGFGVEGSLGNDVVAPRKAVVVAAEDGNVVFSKSRFGGCLLTLYGFSRTTYLYAHLNNDLTSRNDNAGSCAESAYAPGLSSGARVVAGQTIGFVGDSGNADTTGPRLYFEVHPRRGNAVNPYPYLKHGRRLLFSALPGLYTLRLTGTLVSASSFDSSQAIVKVKVDKLRAWPGGFRVPNVEKTLTINVSDTATIQQRLEPSDQLVTVPLETLADAPAGQSLVVSTEPAKRTLEAQLGRRSFEAAGVVLTSQP